MFHIKQYSELNTNIRKTLVGTLGELCGIYEIAEIFNQNEFNECTISNRTQVIVAICASKTKLFEVFLFFWCNPRVVYSYNEMRTFVHAHNSVACKLHFNAK